MIWLRLAPPSLIAACLSQPMLAQINRSRAVRGTQWNPEDIVKQRSRKERLMPHWFAATLRSYSEIAIFLAPAIMRR
jgi:hypothetical protein